MDKNQKKLLDKPETYIGKDDFLECSFSEHLDKYCLLFNARLWTFKTYQGYANKLNYFIKTYNLNLQ